MNTTNTTRNGSHVGTAKANKPYDVPITETVLIATVDSIERMQSSVNGNPRFRIKLVDGRLYTTRKDSTVGYAVDESWVGKAMKLTVSRGSIINAEFVLVGGS